VTGGIPNGYSAPASPTSPFAPTSPASAPTTPPPNPADVVGSSDWWNRIINNDVGYQQAQAAFNAQDAINQAARNAQMQQAFEQFGDSSWNLGDLAKALGMQTADVNNILGGPDVLKAAQQATDSGVSTLARLRDAAQQAQMHTVNNLAARGILSSGETGYQSQRNAQTAQQNDFDARAKLLSALTGDQGGYTSSRQAAWDTLNAALQAAADRQYGIHGGDTPTSAGSGSGSGPNPGGVTPPVATNPNPTSSYLVGPSGALNAPVANTALRGLLQYHGL
jgi:hypothetical protein